MASIRVVVADQQDSFRQRLIGILGSETDLEVVGQARSGQEALEQAAALAPDVIVAELDMPGQSGIEIAAILKQSMPQAKVMILTHSTDPDLMGSAMSAGALGYLLKSSTPAEVVEALRQVNQGWVVVTPSLAAGLLSQGVTPPGAETAPQTAQAPPETATEPAVPPPEPSAHLEAPLTEKEREQILRLSERGLSNADVADVLGLSEIAVNAHLANLESQRPSQAALQPEGESRPAEQAAADMDAEQAADADGTSGFTQLSTARLRGWLRKAFPTLAALFEKSAPSATGLPVAEQQATENGSRRSLANRAQEFVNGLPLGGTKEITSITIEQGTVKMVVTSGLDVLDYRIVEASPQFFRGGLVSDLRRMAGVIQEALHDMGEDRRRAIGAVPGYQTTLARLQLPKTRGLDAGVVIPREAQRTLGISLETSYLNWHRLPDNVDMARWLVLSATRRSMTSLIDTVKTAGLDLVALELRAVFRWLEP